MEWNRNQVLRLVGLYHSQPALWDTSDPRFKDRQAKRWSLLFIASKMSLPPIDIEKKIHCLRTQFNREYLKMITSARKPTWFAYQPLAFVLRNKQNVPDDLLQWKPGTIKIKEEFIDEFETDDNDVRLTIDENQSLNLITKEDDNTNDNIIIDDNPSTSNNNNNNINNRDNMDNIILSDNDIETSSAVEVILHETNNDTINQTNDQSSQQINQVDQHQNKRMKLNNNEYSTHGYSRYKLHNYNANSYNFNSNSTSNNILMNSDECLLMFGRLLIDELLKVNDYYMLQLAKYEIYKVLFNATTGVYDNCNATDNLIGDNKWKIGNYISDTNKSNCDNNRLSSLNELQTFASVVVNELRLVSNNYSLQVAKFQINRVIFHATTAGIAPNSLNQKIDESLSSNIDNIDNKSISSPK